MSVLGGRGGRSDDWSTQHDRALARASEQLDGPLDADEAAWLGEHLAGCEPCTQAAADYATQRLELRALGERTPSPPRDLWARTSVAIELEARHRSLSPRDRSRRSVLAPYALLAGALVVAVVVGTLYSSQRPGPPTATPNASEQVAVATPVTTAMPTPLEVAQQEVAYLSADRDGQFILYTTNVSRVCPKDAGTCATTEPSEKQSIGPLASPESVFGSGDAPLVVLGDDGNGTSVFVVDRPDQGASPTPTPKPTPSPTAPPATASPPPTQGSASASPPGSVAPTTPSPTPSIETPSPSVEPPSPSPSTGGAIEIVRDVEVVDTTAAYAPDGSAFAFTARPADGSHGPDIYLWKVGDAEAAPITTDHRSVFGSWSGNTIVGSTVVTSGDGQTNEPAAFLITPDGTTIDLPQTGLAWRPAVDPNEGSAVYWSGTVEPTADGVGWRTVAGSLVIGRWTGGTDTSAGPSATPLSGDQAVERSETSIAAGPLADWDARWDETGTRLAVWIADPNDPTIGSLSLYVVDPFDGRIDLANPPLSATPALAGFSIADGRLAWAAPAGTTDKTSRVQILAWTDKGFGQVESAPGDVILVR
jgi:Putative zinc-finger